jgi:hypothetical protein
MYQSCAAAGRLTITGLLMGIAVLAGAAEMPAQASSEAAGAAEQADRKTLRSGEVGIEVGALTIAGTDLHLFYRLADSPWMIGFRYLDYEDDFISIDYDNTDRETQTVTGPFARYLFEPGRARSWYLAGAMYQVTQKIDCGGSSDENRASGLFFGGGLLGRRDSLISYNLGLMFSPGMSLGTDNGQCSSESDGDIDGVLSLMFVFN